MKGTQRCFNNWDEKLSVNITSPLKKASGGLDTALRKSINTAGTKCSYIEKAAPVLTGEEVVVVVPKFRNLDQVLLL